MHRQWISRSAPIAAISYRLDQVLRTARDTVDEIYRVRGGLDLHHLRVLRVVAETPNQNANDVVREARLDRPKVSRIISDLMKRKGLERIISEIDARQVLVQTTKEGIARAQYAALLGDELNC